jgi:hypothetical protein
MRWILISGMALSLMSCGRATLRCDGNLQPINVGAALTAKPAEPAAPGRVSP